MPIELVTITYQKQVEEVPGTVSFYFEKPEGYEYRAGQQASMVLGESPQDKALTRPMSFSSHPADPWLRFTMHVDSGSEFKQKLLSLQEGETIRISAARGQFTWPAGDERLYWIAGGVGITPFASMLRGVEQEEYRRIALFHIAREHFPLAEEYTKLPIIQKQADFETLEGDLRQAKERLASAGGLFHLSGSPKFVQAVRGILLDLGIEKEAVVLDSFNGYEELLNS